jgi:hypothetical protein
MRDDKVTTITREQESAAADLFDVRQDVERRRNRRRFERCGRADSHVDMVGAEVSEHLPHDSESERNSS